MSKEDEDKRMHTELIASNDYKWSCVVDSVAFMVENQGYGAVFELIEQLEEGMEEEGETTDGFLYMCAAVSISKAIQEIWDKEKFAKEFG